MRAPLRSVHRNRHQKSGNPVEGHLPILRSQMWLLRSSCISGSCLSGRIRCSRRDMRCVESHRKTADFNQIRRILWNRLFKRREVGTDCLREKMRKTLPPASGPVKFCPTGIQHTAKTAETTAGATRSVDRTTILCPALRPFKKKRRRARRFWRNYYAVLSFLPDLAQPGGNLTVPQDAKLSVISARSASRDDATDVISLHSTGSRNKCLTHLTSALAKNRHSRTQGDRIWKELPKDCAAA